MLKELKRILGPHYASYEDHLKLSGCGMLEQEGEYVVSDISQLHVGGYSSLIYINTKTEQIYLFWLKGSVLKCDWQLYGNRPVPAAILTSIETRMNEGWGHVATFKFFGEFLVIEKKEPKPPSQPTTVIKRG